MKKWMRTGEKRRKGGKTALLMMNEKREGMKKGKRT